MLEAPDDEASAQPAPSAPSASQVSEAFSADMHKDYKDRLGLRVMEAMHVRKPRTPSQPQNLPQLIEHHLFLSSQVHELVGLLKDQLKYMTKHNNSRLKVIRHFVEMSEGTPLAETIIGAECLSDVEKEKDDDETEAGGKQDIDSLLARYKQLHYTSFDAQDKFLNNIVLKASAWDVAVSKRVQKSRAICDSLRRNLEHYEKKVRDLHASIERSESQEKVVTDAMYEKRERNDVKLVRAREQYEKNAADLCLYLREVTEHGWKDLVPMILRVVNLDMATISEQAEITAKLARVAEEIKDIAHENGFDGEKDRIEALKLDPPEALASPEKGLQTAASADDEESEIHIRPTTPVNSGVRQFDPSTPESIYTSNDPTYEDDANHSVFEDTSHS